MALTHYIALTIGGFMGFAAAAILMARKSHAITCCRDCVHARIETHTGEQMLTCWRHSYGEIVKPSGYCSHGVDA